MTGTKHHPEYFEHLSDYAAHLIHDHGVDAGQIDFGATRSRLNSLHGSPHFHHPRPSRCSRAGCGKPAVGTVTVKIWNAKVKAYDHSEEVPACALHLDDYGESVL